MAEENTITAGKQAARKMARRSLVWEHFARFTDGDGKDKAECKRCRLVLGAGTRSGTSTLRNHVKICKGRDGVSVSHSHPTSSSSSLPLTIQLQSSSAPGESSGRELHQVEVVPLEQAEATEDLARMIALHGYDPSVVEDDHFRSFVRRLHPGFELPSREAFEKVCYDVFTKFRPTLLQHRSKEAPIGTSYCVGTSGSIEAGKEVMYVTCHFIDHQWSLHRVVVNAYEIFPPNDQYFNVISHENQHYNVQLSEGKYYNVLLSDGRVVSREIALSSIVNYTTDIYIGDKMPFMILDEKRRNWRTACPSLDGKFISTTHMDHVLHCIADLLPDSDFAERIFFGQGYFVMTKQEFQELLSELGLGDPRDYGVQWYSCYCSSEILGQLKIPDTESEPEEILLRSLWREIYRAIKRVPTSSSPTSNLCLEELFKVRYALHSRLSSNLAPSGMYWGLGNKSVADVLQETLETIDKAIRDSYLVWSIPLVLDPRYKLLYLRVTFESAYGSETANIYTSEVARKMKELYRSYIEHDDGDSDGSKNPCDANEDSDDIVEDVAVDNTNNRSNQARDEHCPTQDYGRAQAEAELDWYLQDSPARRTDDFDILNWWKVHGSAQYPTVARMARFALAMPTCSKLTSDQTAHVRSIIRGYG